MTAPDRPRYRVDADRQAAQRRVRYVETNRPDDGSCTLCQLDEENPAPLDRNPMTNDTHTSDEDEARRRSPAPGHREPTGERRAGGHPGDAEQTDPGRLRARRVPADDGAGAGARDPRHAARRSAFDGAAYETSAAQAAGIAGSIRIGSGSRQGRRQHLHSANRA